MHSDGNLEMLMARYQEGDLASATTLIESISPQLHRFFAVQFASRADADDLLQETWLRIHRVRHTYRPGEPLLPWFYAIARHVRVDHYRKAMRAAAREQTLQDLPGTTALAGQGEPKTPDIESLLEPLPASQREVILMFKLVGMSLEEVARATSSSVGSVKQKLHRAYKTLRDQSSATRFRKIRSGPSL